MADIIPFRPILKLRWYQQQPLDDFFSGDDNLLLQASTGSGKGETIAGFARKALLKKSRVLIIVRRISLIGNLSKRLKKYGISHGIVQGKTKQTGFDCIVASIDTLTRMLPENLPENISFLVIDEAHDAGSPGYKKIIKHYEKSRRFCLTATPYRMDGPLTHAADRIIRPVSYLDLHAEGFLVCPVTYSPVNPDLSNVRVSAGEFNIRDIYRIYTRRGILKDIARNYKKYADGKRSLLFASSKEIAAKICDNLNDEGIPSAFADDSTPVEEREDLIRRLERKELLVICNVQIFATGVDIPSLEAVIMCRPTKSLTLHCQMAGRGSRISEGKGNFLLLDMAGNVERHGLIEHAPPGWLEPPAKDFAELQAQKTFRCPECSFVFLPGNPVCCPECAWEKPVAEKKASELPDIEIIDDEIDLFRGNEHQVRVRKICQMATWIDERNHKEGSLYFRVREEFGHSTAAKFCPHSLKNLLLEIYSEQREAITLPPEALESETVLTGFLNDLSEMTGAPHAD